MDHPYSDLMRLGDFAPLDSSTLLCSELIENAEFERETMDVTGGDDSTGDLYICGLAIFLLFVNVIMHWNFSPAKQAPSLGNLTETENISMFMSVLLYRVVRLNIVVVCQTI